MILPCSVPLDAVALSACGCQVLQLSSGTTSDVIMSNERVPSELAREMLGTARIGKRSPTELSENAEYRDVTVDTRMLAHVGIGGETGASSVGKTSHETDRYRSCTRTARILHHCSEINARTLRAINHASSITKL